MIPRADLTMFGQATIERSQSCLGCRLRARRPTHVRPDGAHRDQADMDTSYDFAAGRMPRLLQELAERSGMTALDWAD